uniref:Uncharacterized protein n=1 Tax=Avena sativa TaxID=4498 RepID=A0ACD5Z299_AVESA
MDSAASSAHDILKRILLDEEETPTVLPLSLLKEITNDFSQDREIGSGGFAVVYKGMLANGTVAVKKLSNTYMHESKFHKEVECLMKVKHKNIVRFFGYCSDTQGKAANYNGKFVMAEIQQRLLCFEYLSNGSLNNYIGDAACGLEWRICYQIIKGICEGLHYLHRNYILHLDLKPANVLLDINMSPKIVDFGLSKCFHEKQSQTVTSKLCGSIGYFAPESYSGRITFKLDIYSLGVIIIEILTGEKGYVELEDVLEMWKRLKKSNGDTHLLEQVKICAVIGMECIECNPRKRPDTQQIIDRIHEVESIIGSIEVGMSSSLADKLDNTSSDEELPQGTPEERGQTNSCEISKIPELKTTKAENMDGLHEIGMSSLAAHIDNASSDELHEGTPKERGQTNSHKMSKIPELKTTKRGLCLSRFKCWCSDLYCRSFPYTISISIQKRTKSKLTVSTPTGVYYISLDTLRAATQGFSGNLRIWSGSFGSIYRGTLPDGREVVIKRAENKAKIAVLTTYHETAFNSEVTALTRARHKNIMCLIGCCSESGERVLVHDFMMNDSLYEQLHDRSPMAPPLMSWCSRLGIALDAARGIEYMHVYAERPTIHRDIKSANILLDDSWTAKIADFGHSLALKIEQ